MSEQTEELKRAHLNAVELAAKLTLTTEHLQREREDKKRLESLIAQDNHLRAQIAEVNILLAHERAARERLETRLSDATMHSPEPDDWERLRDRAEQAEADAAASREAIDGLLERLAKLEKDREAIEVFERAAVEERDEARAALAKLTEAAKVAARALNHLEDFIDTFEGRDDESDKALDKEVAVVRAAIKALSDAGVKTTDAKKDEIGDK
jgi:chromosome segregation ATPase